MNHLAKRRPTLSEAKRAIAIFLRAQFNGAVPTFALCEDGESSWAFWVAEDLPKGCEDSTSYVHANLQVEWYGTSWRPAPSDAAARQIEAINLACAGERGRRGIRCLANRGRGYEVEFNEQGEPTVVWSVYRRGMDYGESKRLLWQRHQLKPASITVRCAINAAIDAALSNIEGGSK